MKRKLHQSDIELDVDFIGGEAELTAAEEKLISEFIKAREMDSSKSAKKDLKTDQGKSKS